MAGTKKVKKEEKLFPRHIMGKTMGFDQNEDGTIDLPPALTSKIDDILMEERSIKDFVAVVQENAIAQLKRNQVRKQEFWKKLQWELKGFVDVWEGYKYELNSGKIQRVKKEESPNDENNKD